MNYSELTTFIQEACEETFTATQLATFVKQTEQKVYNAVHLPALRKSCDGTATTNNEFLSMPADFLYPHSIAIDTGSGNYDFLVQVDDNFIREAYPNKTSTGTPKYYGVFDVDSFILGPTPDSNYPVRITYGYYPESIVTAGTSWLGDNFDPILVNGSLVEAYRFLKGEEDIIAHHQNLYNESMTLLRQLGDGKLRRDSYRSGQTRLPVA